MKHLSKTLLTAMTLAAAVSAQDLQIHSMWASPQWKAGTKGSYSTVVRNAGNKAAGASVLGIYHSGNLIISTSDRLLKTHAINPLQPLGQQQVTSSVTAPYWLKSGPAWIGAYADIKNVVNETKEWNNSKGFQITGFAMPDLRITKVELPNVIEAGKTYDMTVTTRNYGWAKAQPSTTGVLLSTNQYITTYADDYLRGTPIGLLGPGQAETKIIKVLIPYSAKGDLWVGAYADAFHKVAEGGGFNSLGVKRFILPYKGNGRHMNYTGSRALPYGTATSPLMAKFNKNGGKANIALTAPQNPFNHYVLVWSSNALVFTFDPFSDISLGLLNTPMFSSWLGTVDHEGRGVAQFQMPAGFELNFTVRTHSFWFTPGFKSFAGVGSNRVGTTFIK